MHEYKLFIALYARTLQRVARLTHVSRSIIFSQQSNAHHHLPFKPTLPVADHNSLFFIFQLFLFSRLRQGTRFDTRYPILILLVLFIFGGVCSLFLPETLHQKLPDSMEEARLFGADQVRTSITSWLSIFRLSIDFCVINLRLRPKRCEWKLILPFCNYFFLFLQQFWSLPKKPIGEKCTTDAEGKVAWAADGAFRDHVVY